MQKKVKIKYKVVERIASYGSIGLLGLVLLVLIFPVVGDRSYATCLDGSGNEECAVSALSQEVGVTTKTAIALAMVNQVKIPDVTPKSNGATSYASTKMAVSTNSKEGYSILLQTGTTEGSLVGVTSNIEDASKITNTTKTKVTLDNLENNSYGYALSKTAINDSTTYSHVPTNNTVIHSTTNNMDMGDGTEDYPYGDEYYLAFGTKIGTTLPAGTYSGTVTVSAIANPVTVTSLYDITTMQEMQTPICENTKEGYTKQLIDTRDGKSYWVAKLKDGNCWMTQNLGLTFGEGEGMVSKLTPTESDVTGDWTTMQVTTLNDIISAGVDSNSTRSWSFGKWVMGAPTETIRCSDTKNIANCKSSGFVDVSEDNWKPTLQVYQLSHDYSFDTESGTEEYGLTLSAGDWVAVDFATKTYDPHYLVGNYYQFNTLAAGTASAIGSGEIVSSICPVNWTVPTIQNFSNLISSYNFMNNNYYGVVISPLYFIRSGQAHPSNVALAYAGSAVLIWTRDATTKTSWNDSINGAYIYQSWNVNNFGVGGPDARWMGHSVRCVAR